MGALKGEWEVSWCVGAVGRVDGWWLGNISDKGTT